MPQPKKNEHSKKKKNKHSESSGIAITAATSAASTDLTEPSTVPSEMPPALPKFEFERHNPFAPKASFSSAEMIDKILKDKAIMTEEEYYKKYPSYKKDPNIKGVSASVAMKFLMEEFGSI
ncbi:unnamed protein product [Clonostachys solani]|uniref:Uncharacterized protein n=1 Tax=Clonostachys solani TaxID=160281 RepID=A0A9N9W3G8_9HYPO|nr:unnamed protein product [Clonostachys solani]